MKIKYKIILIFFAVIVSGAVFFNFYDISNASLQDTSGYYVTIRHGGPQSDNWTLNGSNGHQVYQYSVDSLIHGHGLIFNSRAEVRVCFWSYSRGTQGCQGYISGNPGSNGVDFSISFGDGIGNSIGEDYAKLTIFQSVDDAEIKSDITANGRRLSNVQINSNTTNINVGDTFNINWDGDQGHLGNNSRFSYGGPITCNISSGTTGIPVSGGTNCTGTGVGVAQLRVDIEGPSDRGPITDFDTIDITVNPNFVNLDFNVTDVCTNNPVPGASVDIGQDFGNGTNRNTDGNGFASFGVWQDTSIAWSVSERNFNTSNGTVNSGNGNIVNVVLNRNCPTPTPTSTPPSSPTPTPQPGDPSCTANFSPLNINSGQSSTLSWNSANDSNGLIPYACTGNIGSGTFNAGNGSINTFPGSSQTCTLTVQNSSGVARACSASVTVNSVPPPSQSPLPPPISNLDAASCTSIGGWAFDPEFPNQSINVNIWKDAPWPQGSLVQTIVANTSRPDVNSAYSVYGLTGNHGFALLTPDSLKDGLTHNIYAYAIDASDNSTGWLSAGSPIAINCSLLSQPPTVDFKVNGSDSAVTVNSGDPATISWTSSNATSCSAIGNRPEWTGNVALQSSEWPSQYLTYYPVRSSETLGVSCTGPAGTVSDSVTINVLPPPAGSVSGECTVFVGAPLPPIPSVSNTTVIEPDYCASGPAATIKWEYNDPAGNPQYAYQVQIDDQGSFNNPEIDTGKIISGSKAYFTGQGILLFGTTYKVRVRAWNSLDEVSGWTVGNSWKTPNYPYPQTDFSWVPSKPFLNNLIQFTDRTVFNGNPNGRQWSWTFGDGSSSTQQNPSYTYVGEGTYYVTLTATDNANQVCSKTEGPILIQRAIPIWKEIAPR